MEVSRRHPLAERDLKEVLSAIEMDFGVDLSPVLSGDIVEVAYIKRSEDVERLLLKDGKVHAFLTEGRWYPSLHALLELGEPGDHFVKIDMGAVKPVASGADVMAPGIVEVGEVSEGDGVVVIDERHRRPLAVGVALMEGKEMVKRDKGRAVRNVHHVGDAIWEVRL